MTTTDRFKFGTPYQPKKKDFRPSASPGLINASERPEAVAAFDAMAANRPLKPLSKNRPIQVAK
jgi:hypothetical protein